MLRIEDGLIQISYQDDRENYYEQMLSYEEITYQIQYLPICAGYCVKYGLPMEEGLKALTIYPAQICRTDDRVGSPEPGKDADIAVFDGNPTHTLYTIVDGMIVYKLDCEQ